MSHFDTNYVRAEQAYRAARIRDEIVGRRQRARLRKDRERRQRGEQPWSE
jgi:hypothetical protein